MKHYGKHVDSGDNLRKLKWLRLYLVNH